MKWNPLLQTRIKARSDRLFLYFITAGVIVFSGCQFPGNLSGLRADLSDAGQVRNAHVRNLLNDARRSTYLINTVSYYTQYFLPDTILWSRADVNDINITRQGWDKTIITRPASGTGTLVWKNDEDIALLTSAHLFNLPDTIYVPLNDLDPDLIGSVLLRTKNEIFLPDIHTREDLEIAVIDNRADICILKGKADPQSTKLHLFPFTLGNSYKLEWGSRIYVIGFPQGFQMITRGLVSKPFKYRSYQFSIDAPFNRGMSGAPILAYNLEMNTLQLMGIGKSVSAESHGILIPENIPRTDSLSARVEYDGRIFVDKLTLVNQGICFTVSSKEIRDFIQSNNRILQEHDINFHDFLNPPSSNDGDD